MTESAHWEGEPVRVWADLWGVPSLVVHDVVGSTNDELRRHAARGARPWTVVLADAQTAGRGRGGAAWRAAPGAGLLCSILLPGPAAAHPGALTLLVGLAVARAVEAVAPGVRAGIKWPNDVLLDGRKCCGILCEAVPGGVVAGVGVNVRSAFDDFPADLRARVTCIEEVSGAHVSRSALAGRLLRELRRLVDAEAAARLGPGVLRELADRDVLAGRPVETHLGAGLARGIASDGALLVDTDDGRRHVVAGSVRLV